MIDYMKTMRWTLCTTGAILIVLGILSFFHSLETLFSLAFFVGAGFLITGVNHLIPWFSMKGSPLRPLWLLPQSVLDILLGLLMLIRPGLTAFMIPVALGCWILLMAFLRFFSAFQVRRAGLSRWWMMLLSAVALVFCGMMMIASPLAGVAVVTWLVGSSFIGAGLLAIAEGRLLYS
ncbi:MAG: DUF308 domain-containing protein [Synergistaceae bacterium]|jgi:uncharacterized membrane protein HdeD (DUF308 family)|nr:DUF308 domain-containing protein [Synergistaceae bacterium]